MPPLADKIFIEKYVEICERIRANVDVFSDNSEEAKLARTSRALTDKIYFFETYFPHYREDAFAEIHREMSETCDITMVPSALAGFRESGKSSIMSLMDPCHKILFRLRWFIEIISSSEDNATEYTMNIMAELESNPRLLNDFGDVRGQRWMLNDFYTKQGQRVLALGPRQKVKGKRVKQRRPDHIIVEDLEDRNSSKKPRIIRRILKWLTTDVLRSVNSKLWSFVFIGNYFSKKTIIHKLLTDEQYKHWNRKIISALYIDKNGKLRSSWEARHPLAKLLKDKDTEPSEFRVEMEQKPEDEEGTYQETDFHYYQEEDIIGRELTLVTYLDPSVLKGEEHCYKAVIAIAVDKKRFQQDGTIDAYVREAWIKKTSASRMIQSHLDISKRLDSICDGYESNGGQGFLLELYTNKQKTYGKIFNLKGVWNSLNKEDRIIRRQSVIQNSSVKFLRNHSDQNLLIEQFLDFPDGDKDGPDAFDGALQVLEKEILKIKRKVKAKVYG